jgi:hypothetical protein
MKNVNLIAGPVKAPDRRSAYLLWVKGGHFAVQSACPLYPPKADTFAATV